VDIALQRRRLMITLGLTTVALVIAMAALVALLVFHAGFGSHAWLIAGAMREKPGS
jgi:hypothetical protein